MSPAERKSASFRNSYPPRTIAPTEYTSSFATLGLAPRSQIVVVTGSVAPTAAATQAGTPKGARFLNLIDDIQQGNQLDRATG